MTWFLWLLVALLAIAVVVCGVVLAFRAHIEGAFLLQPDRSTAPMPGCHARALPSGALLYELPLADRLRLRVPADAGAGDLGPRPLLFLKGNAGTVAGQRPLLDRLAARGYRVLALEYRGFGDCAAAVGRPTADTALQDAREAWATLTIGDQERAVLAGFSLGGGLVGELLRRDGARPAQVVLLNTFSSLRAATKSALGTGLTGRVAAALCSDWDATAGVAAYSASASASAPRSVLVVRAEDDALFDANHAHRLFGAIDRRAKAVGVGLRDGGHSDSLLQHADTWMPGLLDA